MKATPATSHRDAEIHDIFVRGVVPVVMLARGCEALHASAVAIDERGIPALCATSGTGKSTLSLAMTTVGVRHFADDTLVYRLVDGRPPRDRSSISPCEWTPRGSRPFWCRAAAATGDGGLEPFAVLESCLSVVARSRTRPFCAQFTAVPCHRRHEVLLTHSHPFEMGTDARQRAFHERLLAVGRGTPMSGIAVSLQRSTLCHRWRRSSASTPQQHERWNCGYRGPAVGVGSAVAAAEICRSARDPGSAGTHTAGCAGTLAGVRAPIHLPLCIWSFPRRAPGNCLSEALVPTGCCVQPTPRRR